MYSPTGFQKKKITNTKQTTTTIFLSRGSIKKKEKTSKPKDVCWILTKQTLPQRRWQAWHNDGYTAEWRLVSLTPWKVGFCSIIIQTFLGNSRERFATRIPKFTLWCKLHIEMTLAYFRPVEENMSILRFSQATETTCLYGEWKSEKQNERRSQS